jgi:type IV pilus assembly protein PilA
MLKARQGFTLIELLIVVVIIGILAAIAIPKFSATRERAFVSSMKADLRNLATQQDIFYSSTFNGVSYTYTNDETDPNLAFSPSEGVVVIITEGTTTGWAAYATHDGLAGRTPPVVCEVFHGDAVAPGQTQQPPEHAGVIYCDPLN